MKTWKVILAALVLFMAGALTGAVLAWKAGALRTTASKPAANPPNPWIVHRPDFVERMKRELELTPEQAEKVTEAVRISRQRTDFLWEMLKEPLQEELQMLRQNILAVLNPDQQAEFEELIRPRPRKPGDPDRPWGGGRGQRPPGGPDDRDRDRRPDGAPDKTPPRGAPPGGKPAQPPPAGR